MQPTMTMTSTSGVTDGADAPEDKNALVEKMLMMNAEELALFIYLAGQELGLRFD